jgi:HAD superfamily hydrolase (TIGR01549 family)
MPKLGPSWAQVAGAFRARIARSRSCRPGPHRLRDTAFLGRQSNLRSPKSRSMNVDSARLSTILFDVDGTLYRQGPLRRAMLVRLLKGVVARPGSALATFRALRAYRQAQESLRRTPKNGPLAAAQLRLASEQSGMTEDVVARIVVRWMEEEPLPLLGRFVEPALRELLSTARQRGLLLGVVSDYPAAAKLDAMQLTEFFTVVVTAQDAAVNRFKPDPSGLIEAMRQLGAAPDRALYVGDREDVDGGAARAAGIPCIILGRNRDPTASSEHTSVSDYSELHAMLFPSPNERQ